MAQHELSNENPRFALRRKPTLDMTYEPPFMEGTLQARTDTDDTTEDDDVGSPQAHGLPFVKSG